jgi:hypothetical protein
MIIVLNPKDICSKRGKQIKTKQTYAVFVLISIKSLKILNFAFVKSRMPPKTFRVVFATFGMPPGHFRVPFVNFRKPPVNVQALFVNSGMPLSHLKHVFVIFRIRPVTFQPLFATLRMPPEKFYSIAKTTFTWLWYFIQSFPVKRLTFFSYLIN